MKLKSSAALILALALLGLVGGLLLFSGGGFGDQTYRTFTSPDGRFRVIVFRKRSFAATMPGQSGDSIGTVKLYDRNGKVLRTAKVEMVQLVDQVEWETNRAVIKFVADWDLPRN